jgi:hypothetical protein
VAVGRRLGYPPRLVKTACHHFCRWDEQPFGERFNIEIGNGLNTYQDEHYLTWPVDIRGTNWQEDTMFLRSLSPHAEVADSWAKRGYCLLANGRLEEAVDSFAVACSFVTNDNMRNGCLLAVMKRRREVLRCKVPGKTPKLRIFFPQRRRDPELPIELERNIIAMEVLERILNEPVSDVDLVEVTVTL